MTALPFELLLTAFKELDTADLRQCQLVSKLWNQASLEELYSIITIDTEEKSRLYVRTIKRSPQLGSYLETIVTKNIYEKYKEFNVWDKHGLLDTVINHCPNLLNLNHKILSSVFWKKLMCAASQGRLSRLKNIAGPWEYDYDCYVDIALSFKARLNTLDLPGFDYDVSHLLRSEAYPILRNNLNQFPCLRNLLVSFRFVRPLSHYDRLIDDCKHLKKLSILTSNNYEDMLGTALPKINPRPDILEFKCKWVYIKEDNQLNYVMQKFPNLESLSVLCDHFDCEYLERDTSDVLKQFVHFAINRKEIDLEMVLEQQECLKLWSDIISTTYKLMELKISVLHPRQFEREVIAVKFNNQHQLHLQFVPTYDFVLLYMDFLTKSGENIQRLSLQFFCERETYESKVFYNIRNIIDAIKFCPSLQHLELEYIHDLDPHECIKYQHNGVKSLKLLPAVILNAFRTLEYMSQIFPNLKELELSNYLMMQYGKSTDATIIIKNTSLDIFKWTFLSLADKNDNNFEVYIRLNINSGERFYVASGNKISSINSKDYKCKRSAKDFYLDITCQHLTKLQINNFFYTL